MSRFLLSYILLLILAFDVAGQTSQIKRAQKLYAKGEYDKVEELIYKSFEKDSLSPAAYYMKSSLWFTTDYDSFQIDSAYQYVLLSRQWYDSLDNKEKEKHQKIDIDLVNIDSLKRSIDQSAFDRATSADREEDYIFFLRNFPTSSQVGMAINLRNERAFQKAVKVNTYQGYKAFMERYPEAQQVHEAEKRYEKLYFDKSTADDKLASYQRFLKAHPTTPYRKEAENRIFQVLTVNHDLNGYLSFLKNYPKSYLKPLAIDYMFHVAVENQSVVRIPKQYLNDSLLNAANNYNSLIVPYLQEKRFGFIDHVGKVIQKATYEQIGEDYICGGLVQDFYVADAKLYSVTGSVIYEGPFDLVDDIGAGLLRIEYNDKVGVYHKSGREIFPVRYSDVKLIHDKFLAVKEDKRWQLYSISQVPLTESVFDNIFTQGDFIIFEQSSQFDIKKDADLTEVIDNNSISFKMIFDDYDLINDSTIWLQSSYGETIYDAQLQEIIPYDSHEISYLKKGYTVKKENVFRLYDSSFNKTLDIEFDQLEISEGWVIHQKDSLWYLNDLKGVQSINSRFDSLGLLGNNFVIGFRQDSLTAFTQNKAISKEGGEGYFSLVAAPNALEYLMYTSKNEAKKYIYNTRGQQITHARFDEISAVGQIGLSYESRGKRGLISVEGDILLKPRYDAIARIDEGLVSILSRRKFGLYDGKNDVLIPPEYDRNLQAYNDQYYVAVKDDKKILINQSNEKLSDESFEEVKFWNDTSALVKFEGNWKLYDLQSGDLVGPNIRSLQFIKDTEEEILAIILVGSTYGVWSSTKGEVISPTFNDIINVGTIEQPVYFTEKNIAEAEFYVVIYYDQYGQLIFKTAMEAEYYPLIYCDD